MVDIQKTCKFQLHPGPWSPPFSVCRRFRLGYPVSLRCTVANFYKLVWIRQTRKHTLQIWLSWLISSEKKYSYLTGIQFNYHSKVHFSLFFCVFQDFRENLTKFWTFCELSPVFLEYPVAWEPWSLIGSLRYVYKNIVNNAAETGSVLLNYLTFDWCFHSHHLIKYLICINTVVAPIWLCALCVATVYDMIVNSHYISSSLNTVDGAWSMEVAVSPPRRLYV